MYRELRKIENYAVKDVSVKNCTDSLKIFIAISPVSMKETVFNITHNFKIVCVNKCTRKYEAQ